MALLQWEGSGYLTVRQRFVLVAAALVAAGATSVTAACGGSPAAKGSAETSQTTESSSVEPSPKVTEVVDALGRTVEVPNPVRRVAILDRGPAEVLSGLGVMDTVVAVHQSLDGDPLYPDMKSVPVVATWSEVNLEAVAQVQPDLLISSVEGGHGVISDDDRLAGFGIVDFKVNLRDPRTISDEVLALGTAFGKQERARHLVDFYARYTKLIAERVAAVPERDRPRVFLQTHPGLLNTGGSDSAWYEQIPLAGGVNIAADLSGLLQVDAEWVAKQDPDVIVIEGSTLGLDAADGSSTNAPDLRDEVLSAPGLRDTVAAQSGRVYVLPIDLISRPGYIVGEIYLAKILYPDLFADIDPASVHGEFLALFHPEVAYSGSWVYPAVP